MLTMQSSTFTPREEFLFDRHPYPSRMGYAAFERSPLIASLTMSIKNAVPSHSKELHYKPFFMIVLISKTQLHLGIATGYVFAQV